MKATVGHLKIHYLALTETFIYGYLVNARRFDPLVLTDVARNLSLFPIDCSYLITQGEVEALRRGMGARSGPFLRVFLGALDYPNCFERFIRERDIGLLHAHFGVAGCRAVRLKRRVGVPLVTTFYGVDAAKWLSAPEMRRAFKRLFQEGDLFLALGKDMVGRLRAAGCPEEKIRIQRLGVDVEEIAFHPRRWPEDGKRVVLLYCGRLVEKKGILYALEAFARLADRWKDLEFRVVGGGPLRPDVEQAVWRMDLQDRVVLRGALPHAEAMKEMRDAHLFILPSLTAPDGDMEGTPTVLMEAQASGLPVVSTHHADIPEVVLDGESGFLVPERDSRALTDRLSHLLETPDRWPEIGLAGRGHIERRYNIHREAQKLEDIYADLL